MQRRSFLASIPLILAAPFTSFHWKYLPVSANVSPETVRMLRVIRHSCEQCREGSLGFDLPMSHYRPTLEIVNSEGVEFSNRLPGIGDRLRKDIVTVPLDWDEPEALYGLSG